MRYRMKSEKPVPISPPSLGSRELDSTTRLALLPRSPEKSTHLILIGTPKASTVHSRFFCPFQKFKNELNQTFDLIFKQLLISFKLINL